MEVLSQSLQLLNCFQLPVQLIIYQKYLYEDLVKFLLLQYQIQLVVGKQILNLRELFLILEYRYQTVKYLLLV